MFRPSALPTDGSQLNSSTLKDMKKFIALNTRFA